MLKFTSGLNMKVNTKLIPKLLEKAQGVALVIQQRFYWMLNFSEPMNSAYLGVI